MFCQTNRVLGLLLVVCVSIDLDVLSGQAMEDEAKLTQANGDLLSESETIGAVFARRGLAPKFSTRRCANPAAKEHLWKIINDRAEERFNAAAISMLSEIGDSADARRINRLIHHNYEGKLDVASRSAIRACYESLGFMASRGIKEADEYLDAMTSRAHWAKLDFHFYDAGEQFRTEDDLLEFAMVGYSLAGHSEIGDKRASILVGVEGKRREGLEYSLSDKRLADIRREWFTEYKSHVEASLRQSCQVAYENYQERKLREAFLAAGKRVPPKDPKIQTSLYYRGDIGDTKVSPGSRPRTVKGIIRYDDAADKMAADAEKWFRQLVADAVADKLDRDKLEDALLIRGMHEKWDRTKVWKDCKDFEEVQNRLRTMLVDLHGRKLKPVDFEVWVGGVHVLVDGRRGKVCYSILFRLEGTEELGQAWQKENPTVLDNMTVMPDGSLVVWIKNIDGDWYWNPFGW